MTVKPIDLQTNLAHLHEIAKGEHGRAAANIQGQHSLEETAEEKARLTKSRLEENKQAEKTSIMKEEGFKGKKQNKKQNKDESEDEEKKNISKIEKMGIMIDVKR
ncbi:MAG: hypothetical protein JW864_13070 [Spirochaetes bacterium]|nr:hypothetical protein [Spirochaetota bacterium]